MANEILKPRAGADYTYSPGITFTGNLPQEIFLKPSESTPALSDIFNIRQGIRTDEYLILATEQGNVVTANAGCQPTYTSSGTLSDRKISVAKLGVYREWCKDDWTATANVLANDPTWVGNGNDGYDITTKLNSFIDAQLLDAVRRDIFALAFFGNDTAGTAFWRSAGEGIMVKLYDAFSSYCVKRVDNTLPNQFNSNLAADQALDAFKALLTRCNNRLKAIDSSQKVIITTQSMVENLFNSYESKTAGANETQFRYLENGITRVTYRGVEIMGIPYLDTLLETSTNPFYNNLRHFGILMPKASSKFSNLVLGTESAADLNKLTTFYDPRLRTVYKQMDFRLGFQFINCDLIAFVD